MIVFPFAYVAGMSLYNEATGEFVGTANFRRVLSSTDFLPSVWVSLVWTISNLVIQTVCGLALGLFLNQRFRGRDTARTLFLVPFVVPTAVVALMFSWMVNSTFGIFNHLILTSGLSDTPHQLPRRSALRPADGRPHQLLAVDSPGGADHLLHPPGHPAVGV